MVRVFERMASVSGFSQGDCEEFFSESASLTAGEIGAVLGYLLGRLDSHDAAAFVGAVRALHPPRDLRCVDGRTSVNLVGTGGGPSTFNITTSAAFVVAAAGAVVVKTGSRACRSQSGFLDVAARLGTVKLSMPWTLIESIVAEVGIVFVPLTCYAPALAVFEQILTPTVYRNAASYLNKVGPLLAPVRVGYRFLGANTHRVMEMLAGASCLLGDLPGSVVSAEDGLDEVSTTSRTRILRFAGDGSRKELALDPRDIGITLSSLDDLRGHEPAAAAECCERILGGEGTAAQTDIVALNAGAVLTSLGMFADLASGFQAARQILKDGEALNKLQQLRHQVWKWVKR